jgi:hypothetical protein
MDIMHIGYDDLTYQAALGRASHQNNKLLVSIRYKEILYQFRNYHIAALILLQLRI